MTFVIFLFTSLNGEETAGSAAEAAVAGGVLVDVIVIIEVEMLAVGCIKMTPIKLNETKAYSIESLIANILIINEIGDRSHYKRIFVKNWGNFFYRICS